MHVLIGIAIIIGVIYFAIVSPQFRMAVAGFGVLPCLVIIVGTLHCDDSGHLYYPTDIEGIVGMGGNHKTRPSDLDRGGLPQAEALAAMRVRECKSTSPL